MSTVENVSSTVDCQNSVQPETCDKTKDDMEQCHSIEKSTDNIENEERETDVGSSTADAKPSDNSAERAEVVEEECHQKVIHELTKDSELIQKEETQTIDVDDVSHCSHGSICEPDKQKDDIFDKDTKDIENFENKEDAVAQEDKSISKCDESAVAKDTSLAEGKSEKENAPETVDNSSKDEAEADTEVDKHSSVEELASKETYEAVYSDILQPQKHISNTEKDVSEADNEKDTSEAQQKEDETDHKATSRKSSRKSSINAGDAEDQEKEDETDHEATTEAKESSRKSSRKSSWKSSRKSSIDAGDAKAQDKENDTDHEATTEAKESSIDAGDAEADNKKDSSEVEKEESVNKDNSLADDKPEKGNAPDGEEFTTGQDDTLPVSLEENKQEQVKTMEELTGSHNDGEDALEDQLKEVSTKAPEKTNSMEPENEMSSQEPKDVSSTDEKYDEEENKDTDVEEIHKNASMIVEDLESKVEEAAATEQDKHCSAEDLVNKETYEAVYSDILQPQEDISGAEKDVSEADNEKDVSEADNEKDTSEAEKEESVAKDTSITDDKSEKENALETVFKAPPAFETDKFHQIPEDKSSIDYPKYGEELSSVQDDKLPIGLEENKQYEVKTMEEVTESQNDEEVASTAPETVEDSSKDEADAATEQDEHCFSENLSNKETYEAVYSNILQPQEDISVAEKDVSEADNEKDSSEAEKEESVNKDNSLDDDKSEKETTPEIIVDSFEKEKDSSMAENDKLFKEAGNDKDTSEAVKDKSEDKNISETDKQMSEEKNTSEAEKENSDDKDASLVDEKSEKETAPEIAADSFETDKFHPIPADKSPIEFPKYGTEFGSKESSMAENNKLSKKADNEADTEKDISEADERETSEAEKDKSVSKDTSLADEKSEKETVPEITDDSLTKEKDLSIDENAKEAEKEEHASEDKSEKDIAPETVDESSKDKAVAATEIDKHSSAEDLVDKSKYLIKMNVNEPHL